MVGLFFKVELSDDPAKEMKLVWRNTCTNMPIVVQFTTAKTQNQPKFHQQRRRYICNEIVFIYKENKILPFAVAWIELEDAMLWSKWKLKGWSSRSCENSDYQSPGKYGKGRNTGWQVQVHSWLFEIPLNVL